MATPIEPPQKLSEVKSWLATHGRDPRAFAALSHAPRRKQAVVRACVRALLTLGGPRALDALCTYGEGGDEGVAGQAGMDELGAAWGRFDRREFASRLFGKATAIAEPGGFRSIEGIDAVLGLSSLSFDAAEGCSLAPLRGCPGLLSLSILAHGDLDLAPIADLPALDSLSVRGDALRTLEPLRSCRARHLRVDIGLGASFDFLACLPRLQILAITTPRAQLADDERAILRALVARGVTLGAYSHEPWSSALPALGESSLEVHGIRATSRADLGSLSLGSLFLT